MRHVVDAHANSEDEIDLFETFFSEMIDGKDFSDLRK